MTIELNTEEQSLLAQGEMGRCRAMTSLMDRLDPMAFRPTTQEAAEIAARLARTLGVSPAVAAEIVRRTAQTGQIPAEHRALALLFAPWNVE